MATFASMLISIDKRVREKKRAKNSVNKKDEARISSSLTNGYKTRKSRKATTGQGWREPFSLVIQIHMHYSNPILLTSSMGCIYDRYNSTHIK
jgi:hypothetical protein